ncbi:DUF6371 domain-containing protein [Peijinzhouia sedimentorum]
MTEYRYILEKGSKKHLCPYCNKKTLVRYIDTETNKYLPDQYGRCDRESKCSLHLNPYLDGYVKEIQGQVQGDHSKFTTKWKARPKKAIPSIQQNKPINFDTETYKQTLNPKRYGQNIFIQNLLKNIPFPFEAKAIEKVISLYYLGTIAKGYRKGAVTFPFIDKGLNIRAVQVKQFDTKNHTTGTDFLHSIIEKDHRQNNKPFPEWLESYLAQDKRVSCLFGEHLLTMFPTNPIALVEAPKTAIYGTLYFGFPEQAENLIWMAVYNKSSFSFDKLKVLQGRSVYVFPDLSKDGKTFTEWQNKALEYESRLPGTHFIFSDLLEKLAPIEDKNKGNDLGDYLIKLDCRNFRTWQSGKQNQLQLNRNSETPQAKVLSCIHSITKPDFDTFKAYIKGLHFKDGILINDHGYPATWDTTKDCRMIDEKTKSFIIKLARYPELLEYVKTNY